MQMRRSSKGGEEVYSIDLMFLGGRLDLVEDAFTSNVVQIWHLKWLNQMSPERGCKYCLDLYAPWHHFKFSQSFYFLSSSGFELRRIVSPEPLDTLCKSIDFSVSAGVNPLPCTSNIISITFDSVKGPDNPIFTLSTLPCVFNKCTE